MKHTGTKIKILVTVFWVELPCSNVVEYKHIGGP